MSIKIEMLKCFVAVARRGNLADAAAMLGRTPPAVSMMLKQLETTLGSPLFEAGRKNKLTALGRHVLGEAARELEHFEVTTRAIEAYARSESGLVRVAAVPSVAAAILPRVVRIFKHDHPGVQVDIRDIDSLAVLRELERERIDLGIATSLGADADVEREEIFSDPFGIVCRSDHSLVRKRTSVSWKDLKPSSFIANTLCAHIDDDAFQSTFLGSKLMVHNTTSLLAMVRDGVGVTVLPQLVVGDSEHDLTFLPVKNHHARRRIEILRRARSSLSPAANNFEMTIRTVAKELNEKLTSSPTKRGVSTSSK